jgi:hypothetical protein
MAGSLLQLYWEYCRLHEDDNNLLTFHAEHVIAKQQPFLFVEATASPARRAYFV